MLRVLAFISFLITVGFSHMCLLNPYQRGGEEEVDTWGSSDCGLITYPCGGIPPDERTKHIFDEGETWIFAMQKNENHFSKSDPGSFCINLLDNSDNIVKTLGCAPDTAADYPNIYQLQATIPDGLNQGDHYVIQAIYTTNNSSAPAAFYQCSDVIVV